MPTILDAAGVSTYSPVLADISDRAGPILHGHSLIAEVRSQQDAWSRPIITQNIAQAAIDGSYFEERAIRTEKWKLILRKFDINPRHRVDELYDMESDPEEKKNLCCSGTQRAAVKELAATLRK